LTATKSPIVIVPAITPWPAIAITATRPTEMMAPCPMLSSESVRLERIAASS